MIISKQDLNFYITEDLRVNKAKLGFKHYVGLFCGREKSHIMRWIVSLRKYEYSYNNKGRSQFFKIYYYYRKYRFNMLSFKYKLFCGPNMVGYGLRMAHMVGGVIINCKSMGNYCSVTGGVIIGNKNSQENRATIGSHVAFTLGCKVIGKINIGDNVVVAPNSVVIRDVIANSIVSGIPAIVIKKKADDTNG